MPKSRRTLERVGPTPTPQQLYDSLMSHQGWPYTENADSYLIRDRALVSILYIGELRISEALRIVLSQFEDRPETLLVHDVLLSKTRGKPRYRELRLPKQGERACFTQLIEAYLEKLKQKKAKVDHRLFPWSLEVKKYQVGVYEWKHENKTTPRYSVKMVGTARAWQIVNALLPELTQHWLRVYGEKFLMKEFGKFLNPAETVFAVAKTVKVDPRTAIKYLGAGEEELPIV